MKGEKIIEKKFNFNVTALVIHDKELSDKLLKEAIKEKTSNNNPHVNVLNPKSWTRKNLEKYRGFLL